MADIKRHIGNKIFEFAAEELKQIHKHLTSDGGTPKWNMQWRTGNEIVLYYKGTALSIKLNAENRKEKFRLNAYKTIRETAVIQNKRFFSIHSVSQMSQIVCEAMEWFEKNLSDQFEGPKRQKERQDEQYIAAALEGNLDFLVLDMEVVVPGGKSEGDLLALVRNNDSSYSFLPIELKRADQDCSTAKKQVIEFANTIDGNISTFIDNYQKVYKQKQRIGIIDDSETIRIAGLSTFILVVILDENEVYDSITVNCGKYNVKELHTTRKEFIKLNWREDGI